VAHDGKFRREGDRRNSADRFGITSDRVGPPRLAASFISSPLIATVRAALANHHRSSIPGASSSGIFDRHNSELAPASKVNLNSPTEKPSVVFFGPVSNPLAYLEDRPRLLAAVEVYRGTGGKYFSR
jgi:hypothetical protein